MVRGLQPVRISDPIAKVVANRGTCSGEAVTCMSQQRKSDTQPIPKRARSFLKPTFRDGIRTPSCRDGMPLERRPNRRRNRTNQRLSLEKSCNTRSRMSTLDVGGVSLVCFQLHLAAGVKHMLTLRPMKIRVKMVPEERHLMFGSGTLPLTAGGTKFYNGISAKQVWHLGGIRTCKYRHIGLFAISVHLRRYPPTSGFGQCIKRYEATHAYHLRLSPKYVHPPHQF